MYRVRLCRANFASLARDRAQRSAIPHHRESKNGWMSDLSVDASRHRHGNVLRACGSTAGGKIPDDLKVEIGIQPESGRLAEVVYPLPREDSRGQVQFNGSVQFDRDEFFRVRLIVQDSQGTEEALSRVEATPPGYGRWDLLLYLLPFLAVGFLWFRGMSQRRRFKNKSKGLQAA